MSVVCGRSSMFKYGNDKESRYLDESMQLVTSNLTVAGKKSTLAKESKA